MQNTRYFSGFFLFPSLFAAAAAGTGLSILTENWCFRSMHFKTIVFPEYMMAGTVGVLRLFSCWRYTYHRSSFPGCLWKEMIVSSHFVLKACTLSDCNSIFDISLRSRTDSSVSLILKNAWVIHAICRPMRNPVSLCAISSSMMALLGTRIAKIVASCRP